MNHPVYYVLWLIVNFCTCLIQKTIRYLCVPNLLIMSQVANLSYSRNVMKSKIQTNICIYFIYRYTRIYIIVWINAIFVIKIGSSSRIPYYNILLFTQ